MSDETLWDYPADEPVERHGEFTLTVVHPPFPGPDGVLEAHDEARARSFAEAFGTVDRVLDGQGTIPVTELIEVDTRADLDVIRVGCWGGVIQINDPALISLSESFPIEEQANALAERYPDAVIVAAAGMDLPGADATPVAYCWRPTSASSTTSSRPWTPRPKPVRPRGTAWSSATAGLA
ncbi:DUF6333 family protein [Streptomyces sp. NEAU-YJ-81]|uniref:DUF6333 family protein n=1 Tax=Streptomyces sp. NEAU-YJ-81 TaxID=2820288 RepID=UPI001ABCF773|nr:DUF6333 family protein [Streptomyces sp. NEAU-YJ-81]MBO3677381.1 hypothetical protein [Streptomyces sp. NEAU-YJ-81]